MTTRRFKTKLGTETGKESFIALPFDGKEVFGKARAPVVVTLNAHRFKSTVSVYGGEYFIPVRASNRDAAGIAVGDTVNVVLELDTEERRVDVPPDLAKALDKSTKMKAAWDKLSFTHQREHVEAIVGAKKPET